jgi:hypothetical protein
VKIRLAACAAVALGVAGCGGDSGDDPASIEQPKADVAMDFLAAYNSGDYAAACELAALDYSDPEYADKAPCEEDLQGNDLAKIESPEVADVREPAGYDYTEVIVEGATPGPSPGVSVSVEEVDGELKVTGFGPAPLN